MITLTTKQAEVVEDIIDWAYNPRRKPTFTVGGYAGVGKSSIVRYVTDALGMGPDEVRYVTFTGKASLVLQQKGIPSTTIHSFIYEPKIVSYHCKLTRQMKQRVAGFRLRPSVDDAIKLLVIDECSMVSEKLLRDLRSFGIPILALGDPAQLPPVMGEGNKLLVKPDAFLTDIHRQALNSPIIWLSMLARQGRTLPYGTHGGKVHVIGRSKVDVNMLLDTRQVITCLHRDRVLYNRTVRDALGYDPGLPESGEKLICLKNRWETESSLTRTPLVNGLTVRVLGSIDTVHRVAREFHMNAEIEDCPGDKFYDLRGNLDFFEPLPGQKPDTDGRMDHFDYGYALTVHRSQGSEWPHVLYVRSGFGGETMQRQLDYTAITRAADELIVAI